MRFDIIAFALALFVPAVGALVLLTWWQNARSTLALAQSASFSAMRDTLTTSYERLNARLDALAERLTRAEQSLAQTSGAHLAVELADLAGDVDTLAKSVRKNFGRVFAELHADGALARNEAKQEDLAETPEQVRARLRTEHGLPKIAGRNLNGE